MAHSDFSWRKLISVLGAGLLVFLGFVALAVGGNILNMGQTFYGVMALVSGAVCIACAVLLYRDYTKWADEQNKNNRPNYTL